MSLQEIVDNSRTDKNTCHSYLPLYQELLIKKKRNCKKCIRSWNMYRRKYKVME